MDAVFLKLLLKMRLSARALPILFTLVALTACQSNPPSNAAGALTLTTKSSATATITKIARIAQTCWFKSKDPEFKQFKLASEVNSYAGRPRILLVPKNKPSGLPSLVIEAQTVNGRTSVNAFGPILGTNNGARITSDVQRWAIGKTACSA